MTRFAIIKLLNELPEEELVCLNSTLRPNNLKLSLRIVNSLLKLKPFAQHLAFRILARSINKNIIEFHNRFFIECKQQNTKLHDRQ